MTETITAAIVTDAGAATTAAAAPNRPPADPARLTPQPWRLAQLVGGLLAGLVGDPELGRPTAVHTVPGAGGRPRLDPRVTVAAAAWNAAAGDDAWLRQWIAGGRGGRGPGAGDRAVLGGVAATRVAGTLRAEQAPSEDERRAVLRAQRDADRLAEGLAAKMAGDHDGAARAARTTAERAKEAFPFTPPTARVTVLRVRPANAVEATGHPQRGWGASGAAAPDDGATHVLEVTHASEGEAPVTQTAPIAALTRDHALRDGAAVRAGSFQVPGRLGDWLAANADPTVEAALEAALNGSAAGGDDPAAAARWGLSLGRTLTEHCATLGAAEAANHWAGSLRMADAQARRAFARQDRETLGAADEALEYALLADAAADAAGGTILEALLGLMAHRGWTGPAATALQAAQSCRPALWLPQNPSARRRKRLGLPPDAQALAGTLLAGSREGPWAGPWRSLRPRLAHLPGGGVAAMRAAHAADAASGTPWLIRALPGGDGPLRPVTAPVRLAIDRDALAAAMGTDPGTWLTGTHPNAWPEALVRAGRDRGLRTLTAPPAGAPAAQERRPYDAPVADADGADERGGTTAAA